MAHIAAFMLNAYTDIKLCSINDLTAFTLRTTGEPAVNQQSKVDHKGTTSRLRLVLIICLSAFIGDALDIIAPSQGFEISGKRWYSEVTFYSSSNCPSFVVESLPQLITTMTPIPNSYGGKQNGVGFDRKPTVYCSPERTQALSYLPETVDSDEVFSTLGSARRYWEKTTYKLVDCDIWLNSEFINPENIGKILRHEWGHCLGLEHEDQQLSIMATTLPNILSEELTINDLAGINVLYGLCIDEVDKEGNHFMHKVPFNGDFYYGIMPVDGVWPTHVHTVGKSDCD